MLLSPPAGVVCQKPISVKPYLGDVSDKLLVFGSELSMFLSRIWSVVMIGDCWFPINSEGD